MNTFSDLMNLLLCFFVLLFSMSTVDAEKFEMVVASLQSSFSVLPSGGSSIGEGQLISSGISQLENFSIFFENSSSEGKDTEQKDIFELLHRRRKKSSTIFCSQYVFEEWYDQLGGEASPLTDAIIDRIAHDSYQINITSIDAEHDRSMREVYGLDKTLRE